MRRFLLGWKQQRWEKQHALDQANAGLRTGQIIAALPISGAYAEFVSPETLHFFFLQLLQPVGFGTFREAWRPLVFLGGVQRRLDVMPLENTVQKLLLGSRSKRARRKSLYRAHGSAVDRSQSIGRTP
jgi:hypothetical protein